jgi:NADP-dependent 3-hydroxy acid dehydrogenase YdfG
MIHSLGASSGIGAVYADRLAKRGYDLILVARNGERLRSPSARLTSETGRSITALPADLGDRAALAKVEAVLRDDPRIAMLVNNAGRLTHDRARFSTIARRGRLTPTSHRGRLSGQGSRPPARRNCHSVTRVQRVGGQRG